MDFSSKIYFKVYREEAYMIFVPEYVESIETWQTLINNNKIDYNNTSNDE